MLDVRKMDPQDLKPARAMLSGTEAAAEVAKVYASLSRIIGPPGTELEAVAQWMMAMDNVLQRSPAQPKKPSIIKGLR